MNYLANAKKSVQLMNAHKGKVALVAFLDILFLFLYGLIKGSPEISGFLSKIYDFLKIFLTLVSQSSKQFTREIAGQKTVFTLIRENPIIERYFYLLLFTIIIFALFVYFLYSFLEGSNWYLNLKVADSSLTYTPFVKQFFLVTIPWFILFSIHVIISFINTFRQTVTERLQLDNPIGLQIFLFVYLFTIIYFALISYALIGRYKPLKNIKKTFSLGFKKAKIILPAFLLIVLGTIIINYLLIFLATINFILMFILGILILFPYIFWARIYIKVVINDILK